MKKAALDDRLRHANSRRLDAKAVAALYGLSLKALAEVLAVPAAHLRANSPHSASVQTPLRQLVNAYNGLAEIFPETAILKWMHHPNRGIGRTPLSYLQEHGSSEFEGLVERMLDGGYF